MKRLLPLIFLISLQQTVIAQPKVNRLLFGVAYYDEYTTTRPGARMQPLPKIIKVKARPPISAASPVIQLPKK